VATEPIAGVDVYGLCRQELGLAAPAVARPLVGEWYRFPEGRTQRKDARREIDRDLVAWIDAGIKWIASSRGGIEAYDLSQDEREQRALSLSAAQTQMAQERARAWWAAHPPRASAGSESRPLDPATLEHLRNLGYLD
jgi:hypothetical protein